MDESASPSNSPTSQRVTRRHGLQLPLNIYQIISWIVFFFEFCVIFVVFLPPLSLVLKLINGIVVSVLMVITWYNAYKATKIDPTDLKVQEEHDACARGEDYQTDLRHYCVICNAHVQARTKHCGQCNRCVDVFDHHCIWLNNCVGAQNYKYFQRAILSLLFATSIKLGFGVYILVDYYRYTDEFLQNSQQFYASDADFSVLHHITIASCVINVLLWLLMMKLVTLHMWLAFKGLTTYESIMMAREQQEEIQAREQQRPKKKIKSKTVKNLDDESYIGNNSTINGRSAFQTATGLHIDLEESPGRTKNGKRSKSKGKKSKTIDNKTLNIATFAYSNRKEFEGKTIEIVGRSEAIENPHQQHKEEREERNLEKQNSSLSVAMLNAEPSSFISSSAREYKFQESMLEEEEKDAIEDQVRSDLNDTPPKRQGKLEDRSISIGSRELNTSMGKSPSKKLFGWRNKNKIANSDLEGQTISFGSFLGDNSTNNREASGNMKNLKTTTTLPLRSYTKVDVFGKDKSNSNITQASTLKPAVIQQALQVQIDNTDYVRRTSYNNMLTQATLSKMGSNVRSVTRMMSARSSAIMDEPEVGNQTFQSNNAYQTRKSVSF